MPGSPAGKTSDTANSPPLICWTNLYLLCCFSVCWEITFTQKVPACPAIRAVRSTALENEQTRIGTRYFLTSLTSVERFADSVHRHWSIENQLHWQLDVTFGEDDARMRKDNFPLNWNVMRKTALPFLPSAAIGRKTSLKRNMFIAALDISVLEIIFFP